MKELKDRDNLDLFGLICELSGRYALHNTKTLHEAFFEAKNEFEKRLKALEKERDKLKEKLHISLGFGELCKIEQELQTLKGALKKSVELIKQWHNMPGVLQPDSDKQIEEMWNIYYNHAPEMNEIKELLTPK